MTEDQQEQWTPGVLPSDAKLGTDDPEEEAAQLEGQLDLDLGDEPNGPDRPEPDERDLPDAEAGWDDGWDGDVARDPERG